MKTAVAATLELIASERPDLLDFQLEAFLTSSVRLVVFDLATACQAPLDELGPVIGKACRDLDALEKARRIWHDPAQVVEEPNVAALLHVTSARTGRARVKAHLRKLEAIGEKLDRFRRQLEAAQKHDRSRSLVESFIGPPLPASEKSEGP